MPLFLKNNFYDHFIREYDCENVQFTVLTSEHLIQFNVLVTDFNSETKLYQTQQL